MPNYKKMYFELAGKVATAVELLSSAQRDGESAYMDSEGEVLVFPREDEKNEG